MSKKAREPLAVMKKRAATILRRLAREYPEAHCSLGYRSPFELFVSTVLSAQCTDARVNLVTKDLFRKYRTPPDYAHAKPGELEKEIRSTGFFNSKARNLRRAAQMIIEEFGGCLPETMEELLRLPGVGRKTANVILGNAFGLDAGMVVDTHVGRISRRLGLTKEDDPTKVERDLNGLVPARARAILAHRLIEHGRKVCTARQARCEACALAPLCPKVGVLRK